MFKKILECREQLLNSSEQEEFNEESTFNANVRADDLIKNLKLLNETECPELHNVEVPKVIKNLLHGNKVKL